MIEFHEEIRKNFNINYKAQQLQITLINPYLTNQSIQQLSRYLLSFDQTSNRKLSKLDINIIECVTFDDQMVIILATALPVTIKQLTLDFTGCQSIKGSGFLDLFENVSQMELQKLHLDFSQIYDVNDVVMEGLSMLIQSLPLLRQLYLDFYQIDQVTETGYLTLAQSLVNLKNLKCLHLDFSANPNILEDNLQLFFGNIPTTISSFGFRILDIDGIGGGSFFRLATLLSKCSLKSLNLTISSFSELNPKALYSILKQISQQSNLQELSLNLSNIQMPNKLLGYLKIPKSLRKFCLDISCNNLVTDIDIMSVFSSFGSGGKQSNIQELNINFDFCKNITEQAIILGIENTLQKISQNTQIDQQQSKQNIIKNQSTFYCKPFTLKLTDRKYSQDFFVQLLQIITKIRNSELKNKLKHEQFQMKPNSKIIKILLTIDVEGGQKNTKWKQFQSQQFFKKKLIIAGQSLNKTKFSTTVKNCLMNILAGCQ